MPLNMFAGLTGQGQRAAADPPPITFTSDLNHAAVMASFKRWSDLVKAPGKVEPITREEALANIDADPTLAGFRAGFEALPPGCNVWPSENPLVSSTQRDVTDEGPIITYQVHYEPPEKGA